MSDRGKIILLEGGEGVGKTTQAKLLIERLAESGIQATSVREPGGDPRGEAIRSLILSDEMKGIDPLAELFLFCAARAQMINTVVRPMLEQGHWVVSDRGALSSLVYQGQIKGVKLETVRKVCAAAVGDCIPDVTIVLDILAIHGLQRRSGGGDSNRFEAEGLAFHQLVNLAYAEEARRQHYPVIDASGDIATVQQLIWAEVEPLTH